MLCCGRQLDYERDKAEVRQVVPCHEIKWYFLWTRQRICIRTRILPSPLDIASTDGPPCSQHPVLLPNHNQPRVHTEMVQIINAKPISYVPDLYSQSEPSKTHGVIPEVSFPVHRLSFRNLHRLPLLPPFRFRYEQ